MEKLTHISEDVAETLAFSSDDAEAECTFVAKQFVDKHRWYNNFLIVFRHGDTHYGFTYMEPASETQEGQDVFDLDADGRVPVRKVHAEQVTITKWNY